MLSHPLDLSAENDTSSFLIGSFRIEIDEVRVQDLKAMRKLLPRNEYKLIKNRKCARLSRSRRKEHTTQLMEMNQRLLEENAALRRQLGLPPKQSHEFENDSSDDENDSGGALSNSEAATTHDNKDQQHVWATDGTNF